MQVLYRHLNPKTYRSPSGMCTLFVDPSDPYGAGGAMYRAMRGKRILWQGKRPWTLARACIADDGTVAGYGFTDGTRANSGQLVIALLDPHGRTLREERETQRPSPYLHGPPTPTPTGLFLQPENDRFVVRVAGEQGETWRLYSLTTGRKRPPFVLPAEDDADLRDARPVRGTPLTLLAWHCSTSDKPTQWGVRFTLLDPSGAVVWRLSLPTDFDAPKDDPQGRLVALEMYNDPAILSGDAPRAFTLRHLAARRAVTYTVKKQGGVWAVRESLHALYTLHSDPKPPTFAAPTVRLPLQATITVQADALRRIYALTVLEDGTIVAVDGPTGRAHVFDARGHGRSICQPPSTPEVLSRIDSRDRILEHGPGGTFVLDGHWYARDGRSIQRPAGFRSAAERAATIRRRPDNTWRDGGDIGAVAPGGAFLISEGGQALHLYAADHRPERSIPLSTRFADCPMAYDGRQIVIGTADAACAYRATGEPQWEMPLPKREEGCYWQPFLIEGGRVLCLFDGARTVYRYAVKE